MFIILIDDLQVLTMSPPQETTVEPKPAVFSTVKAISIVLRSTPCLLQDMVNL